MSHQDMINGVGLLPVSTPNWTINVSDIRTVRVSNISLSATKKDIIDFFSYSGDIQFIEFQRETEMTRVAYVTFKEAQGADTAVLMSGSTIVNRPVSITPAENYQLPPYVPLLTVEKKTTDGGSGFRKTEDVVSTMLALGFILGKDTLNRAKSFDEKHRLTSHASATFASIDRKIGLIKMLSTGTAAVNEKVREIDEWFQVSDMTKHAFLAAEQTASSAGSAIMRNRYVSTGASWVSSALSMFAKAAEDLSSMTRDKVEKADEEKKEMLYKEEPTVVNDYARFHLDKSSTAELTVVSVHTTI
ncbi:binding partner of ACD11 1-like isoform X2 [Apium graveolens]